MFSNFKYINLQMTTNSILNATFTIYYSVFYTTCYKVMNTTGTNRQSQQTINFT